MSTLLERMIQRTRGPLSSLEPVSPPAFAAAPPGGRRVGVIDPRQEPRTFLEPGRRQASRPGQPPGEQPGQQPEHDQEEPFEHYPEEPFEHYQEEPSDHYQEEPFDHYQEEPFELPAEQGPGARLAGDDHPHGRADPGPGPFPGPSASALAAPSPAGPEPDRPPARSGPRWPEPRTAAHARPDRHRPQPGPGPAALPADRADREPPGGREHPGGETGAAAAAWPGADTAGRGTDPAGPGAGAAGRGTDPAGPGAGAAGRGTDSLDLEAGAAGHTGAARPGTVTARRRTARPPARQPAGPQAAAEPPGHAASTSGSGPDITISIGHIEVRSTPATDQPRARPPFRPQVSLADFLGQERQP